MKTIFRIGDKVYDINYGWGKVVDVFNVSFNTKPDYRVLVNFKQDFNKEINIYYSMDSKLFQKLNIHQIRLNQIRLN